MEMNDAVACLPSCSSGFGLWDSFLLCPFACWRFRSNSFSCKNYTHLQGILNRSPAKKLILEKILQDKAAETTR
jgi:hypothetical protein